jgi:hypothetical protein
MLQSVLTAIELEDETTIWAAEVDDERRNWMLATKLRASALPIAETLPEPAFRIGLIVAEATSVGDEPRHLISPAKPNPSP